MSSILDALEKANRERAQRAGDPARQDLADHQATLERRLREQQLRHRRQLLLILTGGAVLALLLAGTAGLALLWQQRGNEPEPTGTALAAAAIPAAEEPQAAEPQATPTPEPTATPAPTPSPTATATATPEPSPTPSPSPAPSGQSSRYIENDPPPLPTGTYTGMFQDGDIVRPVDLGLQVDGVMDMGTGLVAIINGRQVRAGAKLGELHLVDVQFGFLTIDIGDGTIVRVRF